jgi:adenylate cyclase
MGDSDAPTTTSIRTSLSRNLIALVIFLGAAILVTTVYTADRIRRSASRSLIDRAFGQAESDLMGFLEPVQRSLILARGWTANGVIDPDDTASLNRLFMPFLEQSPQVSSFNIGDAQGRGFLLLRLGDGWRNRRVHADQTDRKEMADWSDQRTQLRAWTVDESAHRYDPRTRAWYIDAHSGSARFEPGAALPQGVYWTEPYAFFTTGEPGISASVHARTSNGRRIVIAFDVLLVDLSEYTRRMDVSPNGFAVILDEKRRVVGLPNHPLFDDPEVRAGALLRRAQDLGVPAIADGAAAAQRLGEAAQSLFSFTSGGERYWAQIEPVALGANRFLEIAVAIPERDMLGVVQQQRLIVIAMMVLSLVVASLAGLRLSRRVSGPLSRLVGNSQRIGELDLTASDPIASNLTEVDQLAAEQERMRIALDAFSKYVPVELVRELLRRGEAAQIGGQQRELAIVFSDVVGFTTIAESMTPAELTQHMAVYFAELLKIIQSDGRGDVNEIAGDGIVAFWGAPAEDPDHASHAVDAVLRCCARLDELNADWRERGRPPLPTCFGISVGPVVVGNVGAPSRMTYAAVGDSVNVASRVEGLNRMYGTRVLATRATVDGAGPGFSWRWVDRVRVKGKLQPIDLFELLGREGEVDPLRAEFARSYETAFENYRERRFEAARDALEALTPAPEGDLSVTRLLERARHAIEDPPGADWEPVSIFQVK